MVRRYKVRTVDNLPRGYGGLNYYAAKDLGIPYPHGKNTIAIQRGQSQKAVRETVRHETFESEIIRNTGVSYEKAHKSTKKILNEK